MHLLILKILIIFSLILSQLSFVLSLAECRNYDTCINGKCKNGTCQCIQGYTTVSEIWCDYQQKDKAIAFVFSIFFGIIGADWFYDLYRILNDYFKDGNNVDLGIW